MLAALEKAEDRDNFTYADYLEWDEKFRAEIIHGALYVADAPLTVHQRISRRLSMKFANFLEGKTAEVFAAPFSVRLFPKKDRSDDTVVEPDILVVCDPAKIDEKGCNGAPDLIVEILSPSNFRKERLYKFDLYLRAQVREYWVVHPDEKAVEIHLFDRGRFVTQVYGLNEPESEEDMQLQELIPVSVLPGLEIDVKEIF